MAWDRGWYLQYCLISQKRSSKTYCCMGTSVVQMKIIIREAALNALHPRFIFKHFDPLTICLPSSRGSLLSQNTSSIWNCTDWSQINIPFISSVVQKDQKWTRLRMYYSRNPNDPTNFFFKASPIEIVCPIYLLSQQGYPSCIYTYQE